MSSSGGGNTKPSGSALDDIVEPVGFALTDLRKKIRNLEKKKSKLDALREEVRKSGKPLNEDQAQALSRYDDNTQQLETCRELCKSFETCTTEIQKCYKKLLKKNELAENSRLFDLEKYRAIVAAFESEEVVKRYSEQDDTFQGSQRQQLKVLRKILVPLRSDFHTSDTLKSFDDYLKTVTEQQSNLTNGRPVQLQEEAVPDAKALLDRLISSQFFTSHPELLYVKTIPGVSPAQQDRATSSGSRPASNQVVYQNSPVKHGKDDARDHQAQVGFLGSAANQGFHYAAGEPIPSTGISFTNSKLNNPIQPPVAQPTPSVTSPNVHGPPVVAAQAPTIGSKRMDVPNSTHGGSAADQFGGIGGAGLARTSPHVTTPHVSYPTTSPVKEAPRVVPALAPSEVNRRSSECDPISQNQTAWQSGRPFGTFDAKKPHGDDNSISPDAFSSTMNQENRIDTDYDGSRGPNGVPTSNFNGTSQRVRGNGRPYEHQPERRSFDGGRGGGGRRHDEGRGDFDGNRGGRPNDRGMSRGGGGRFMGDNRGPRELGDFDGGRDDDHGDQKPQQSGPGNDADFGVFHVDNPSFKGRTGNGNYGSGGMQEERRGGSFNAGNNGNGMRRGGPRGGPMPMGARRNYGGSGGRYGDNCVNGGGGGYEQ